MKKMKLKEQKGITMVALIFAVIVLALLFIVTIRVLDNYGLYDIAESATDNFIAVTDKDEEDRNALYGELMDTENLRNDGAVSDAVVMTKSTINWTRDGVLVTLSYSSIPEGYTIQYKKGSGEWVDVANGGSVRVEENNTTVIARLYHKGTNHVFGSNNLTVNNIDRTKPTKPTKTQASLNNGKLEVSATGGSDEVGSGFAGYQYSIDGDIWTETTIQGTPKILPGAPENVYVRSVDGVGNTSDAVTKPVSYLYKDKVILTIDDTSVPVNENGYRLGDAILLAITATNNSDFPYKDTVVTYDLTGDEWTRSELKPKMKWTVPTVYYVTEYDVLNGYVFLDATGVGENEQGEEEDFISGAKYFKVEKPRRVIKLRVTESSTPANGNYYTAGEDIRYRIDTTNDGNLTLINGRLTDGVNNWNWETAPGASYTYEGVHTVLPEDVTAGKVTVNISSTGECASLEAQSGYEPAECEPVTIVFQTRTISLIYNKHNRTLYNSIVLFSFLI